MQEKEKKEDIFFEEVLDNEIDDIWDIFFPYMTEKGKIPAKADDNEKSKPRRYLRFLTM